MSRFVITALLFILFSVANLAKAQEITNIEYDFSCMNESTIDMLIQTGNLFEDAFTEAFGSDISIAEEAAVGKHVLEEFRQEKSFIISGVEYDLINSIKSKLEKNIIKPRGFNYTIYLVEDDKTVNAFTAGGNIFITTALVKFCNNNDEIACVIGHEIAHNELGHVKKKLSQMKASQEFWGEDIGALAAGLYRGTTESFNQKNEAHSDMLGMDIAKAAGYDICANIELWKRMAQKDSEKYDFFKLFSSHPYSETRSKCSANHIQKNYGSLCK
jgi:predicted Zn-dependent protease